jgi:hypothetical protein
MIEYLKIILVVQLFYSFAITGLIYAMPAADQVQITEFTNVAAEYDQRTIAQEVEGTITKEFNIPVIELATLVYYSGNILLDLILNFATAVPQMFTILIGGFLKFFNFEAELAEAVLGFISALIMMLYVIAIASFLLNIRSRGTVV